MPPSLSIALKALAQLGPMPLALNLLYRLGLRTGHYQRVEVRALKRLPEDPALETLFALPRREDLERVLGKKGEEELLAQAGEILDGKFRLFGADPSPIQLSMEGLLKHWTQYELHPPQATDLKFVWEPARFGWAYTLGRAYHLTADDRFSAAFWSYFEQFSAANPPYLGLHWMNGQEVAIRLMALVWSAHVFPEASSTTPGRRYALVCSIAQHAARLPHTLLYARSQNNNHLVTEAAGLYTAGLALKNQEWRSLGWRWLNWCLKHQVSSYGEYIQHSTNYHRLVLQTALWVNLVKDEPWPYASMQALERLSHFLFSMSDGPSGRVPNLGANDGALVLPLSGLPYEDFRPTVQAAARAFLDTQLPSGPWDETCLWLGLGPVTRTFEPEHYLGDQLRGSDSWAYLRASSFRSRLGHMDQLHLDLWWRGLNIAQDAGTYLYNAPPPWDNPLTASRVHNTVTVDGRDQMTRGGRFLTLDWFPAWSRASIESDPGVLQGMLAYYKGYRGVRHERLVIVHAGHRWLVQDTLSSSSLHLYRLNWLLPDWEWKLEQAGPVHQLSIKSPHGWVNISTGISSPNPQLQVSLVRCGEVVHGQRQVQPYEGWASPTYGVRIPAISLAAESSATRSLTFTTELSFPP
jgi:hypothetical protein